VRVSKVVPSNGRLDDLAREIHSEVQQGRAAIVDALDCQLRIGQKLKAARRLLPEDKEFGSWFSAQGFGFTPAWGRTLRTAAENESEVRMVVASQLATGRANIEKAVKAVTAPKVARVEPVATVPNNDPAPIFLPPPGPVQGPEDHTYDMEHFKATGVLVCLEGCPAGHEGGSETDQGNGETERVVDASVTAPPTTSVGEGGAPLGDDGEGPATRPSPPSPDDQCASCGGTGVVTVPYGTGRRSSRCTDCVVAAEEAGVPPEPSVGEGAAVITSPVVAAVAGTGSGLDSPVEPVPAETDEWAVLVRGTDPLQFRQLCTLLQRTDCQWSTVGAVGDGQFRVDVAAGGPV